MATVKKIKKADFGKKLMNFTNNVGNLAGGIGGAITGVSGLVNKIKGLKRKKNIGNQSNEMIDYGIKSGSPMKTGPTMKNGGKTMMKRADGSTSQRGLWDNIRAAAKKNKAAGKPGKKPTSAMLKQEKKIKSQTKKK